jgi:tyrosine-protein phosphatase YwqE
MFTLFKKKPQEKPQLFFHTDMHCHLVPGIDDGQRVADEAANLVAAEKSWGINRIICTPHITQDTFENTQETIVPAFNKLKAAVEAANIDIDLDYSAEHRIDNFFLDQLEHGVVKPLPNNYILVENSFVQELWNLDQTLFNIALKGFRPILAHPERYFYYVENPERYKQLHGNGIFFQVNVLSLAGYYGKSEKKTAEMLIEKGFVDFLGTDMHNSRHRAAIEEYIGSKDFYRHEKALRGRLLNDTAFK